ncbi:MAG: prepilin-type N-terminal cleavage/methylation domain-containing protein [Nitrospirae bacterium]|nr:prepilin-type N-terminal cleavage/methylation domain-containing protein [Nitrospirota bacterium]
MFKLNIIKDKKGVTLMELMVVITIIGILSLIGIPEYSRFMAKGSVRRAANDLLQNARLAKTMAIKENQTYVIAFNVPAANQYSIGFDTNGDGTPEGYEGGAVRVVDLQAEYGSNIIFGTTAATGPDQPDSCPTCIAVAGSTVAFGATAAPVNEAFNPDGSVNSLGSVFITHNTRGFTYMLRVSYQSGKFDLWSWDGETGNLVPPVVTSCAGDPVRTCGWTEVR